MKKSGICLSIILLVLFYQVISMSSVFSQSFYWTRTNGPNEAIVNDIFKSSDGKIYSASWGGVFVSNDNGENWQYLGLGNKIVISVAASNGVIFAGTSISYNLSEGDNGLFISTNNGLTWQLSSLGICEVRDLYVSGTGKVFASYFTNGFYDGFCSFSSDSGITWNGITQLTGLRCGLFSTGTANSIYVSSGLASMAYTTNDGATWTINGNTMYGINSIDASVNGYIFGGSSEMLYRTTNNGQHWDSINYYNIYRVTKVKTFANGFTFAGTIYDGLWKSSNFGNNWTGFWYPDSLMHLVSCLEKVNNDIWCGFDYGTLFKSGNWGSNWTEKTSGFSASYTCQIFKAANGFIFAGTLSGLHLSTDNGQNWNRTGVDFKRISSICQNQNGDLYSFGFKIYKSSNNGSSWQIINYPQYMQAVSSVCSLNGDIFFSTEGNIYKSTNNGNSWLINLTNQLQYFNLSIDNFGNLYAAGINKILKTTNSGVNWLVIYNGSDEHITKVISDSNNNLYFGQGNVVRKSTNNGLLWQDINTGYFLKIFDLIVDSSGKLIISSDKGVYYYNGSNFILINNRLDINFIQDLEFNQKGDLLAAAKYSGIYISNGPIGIHSISTEIPIHFSLSQNYPNPFNPTTKIKFSIPLSRGVEAGGGRVVFTKLSVYDVLGREVSVLVNEQLKPGTYEAEWNAVNFPSGIYFYTLKSGDYKETRKMVLIK